MNSWQRTQTLRRLNLVLIATCALAVFAVVWQWRPQSPVQPIEANEPESAGEAASIPQKAPAAASKKTATKKTEYRVDAPVVEAPPEVVESLTDQPDIPIADSVALLAEPAPPDFTRANVVSEGAPVYSSNSTNSVVVRRLTMGDEVDTPLEIIDSGGRWTMVRTNAGNQQRQSGFVRSENLERSLVIPEN